MTDTLAYSIEAAAEVSQLGRTQLFEAIKEGKLKARKSGRRTIILREELNAFLHALPERPLGGMKKSGSRARG